MFSAFSLVHNFIIYVYELLEYEKIRLCVSVVGIATTESTSYIFLELVPITFGSAHTTSVVWGLRVDLGSIHAHLGPWVEWCWSAQPLHMNFEEPHEKEFLLKKETQWT